MQASGDVRRVFEDVKGDTTQQLQQIKSLMGQGTDAIIVTPTDTQVMKAIISLAGNANIPLPNHRTEVRLPDGMVYVSSDPGLAGKMKMQAMANLVNNKGNMMILMGNRSGEDTGIIMLNVCCIVSRC